MQIGVMIGLRKQDTDLMAKFREIKELDLQHCQISIWDPAFYTDEWAAKINEAVAETGITVSTLWCGYSGPVEWNFTYGPMVNIWARKLPPAKAWLTSP